MALTLDFPIVPTTEIDGVLYADFEGKRRALAGRRVELRAADGTLIASTTSAGDGYYLLEAVPPGAWQLVVIGGDGETAPPPRVIHVHPAGDLINGVDIVFTRPGDTSGSTVASADTPVSADAVAAGAEAQERSLPPRRIAVDPGGVFAVQTGAFMSSANAERYAAAVTALGFEPRIEPFLDANKVRWYRVRIGRLDGLGLVLAATETLRTQVSEAAIPVRLTQRP